MMRWQFAHPDNLQLCFRGAGKSTTCTVTKGIHLLLKDPNLRILIASKTTGNSQGFLKEIKGHFETNVLLAEIFGPYYDAAKVTKWDDTEIEVLPRTKRSKEASITCVGVDGTIVSKHYDVILSDDLVDEANSATKYMRDRTKTWYYQTLDPTLEPPDPDVPHRGEHHRLGTRYHYDDLWNHLITNELREHTNKIPALDERERSPWPEKYPPEWFRAKRERAGTIIFNAQYQVDTEAMKGEVFQYDDMQVIPDDELPPDMVKFIGVDLAIGEKETNDQFAIVCIGVTGKIGTDDIFVYVLDYYAGHLRFGQQTNKIAEFYKRHEPRRLTIETNAYQLAQFQEVKARHPTWRVSKVNTGKDKMARAWKLTGITENKRLFFRRGLERGPMVDQLVLFPSHKFKDLFDALDLAVKASKIKRKRKRREYQPGVI